MKDRFLAQQDELAEIINSKAVVLYKQIKAIRPEDLHLEPHFFKYYTTSHHKRLFFSIETSAHILYRAISIKNKPVSDIIIMDYGAGIGTLFILAKLIGCKQVIYNDLFEDWKNSAKQILQALAINIDEYIVGDIDTTLEVLACRRIQCDIIASRNVVEHIYKLDVFYSAIYQHQPGALVFSSTTANIYNPATHIQHVLMHRNYEKVFRGQRKEIIRQNMAGYSSVALDKIAKKTRGLGARDLLEIISDEKKAGSFEPMSDLYTNTCDPYNGVWAEHLLRFSQYKKLIGENFDTRFEPGFWDTHYGNRIMNIFSRTLNVIIRQNSRLGILLAPFVYVIAIPRRTYD